MLDCYCNSKAEMVGMDVMELRDQPDPRDLLDPGDQWDPREQLDSMDVMDPMDVMDSRDQLDLLVLRGKREIEEYSYEGLLGYKVGSKNNQIFLSEFADTDLVTIPVHRQCMSYSETLQSTLRLQ